MQYMEVLLVCGANARKNTRKIGLLCQYFPYGRRKFLGKIMSKLWHIVSSFLWFELQVVAVLALCQNTLTALGRGGQ